MTKQLMPNGLPANGKLVAKVTNPPKMFFFEADAGPDSAGLVNQVAVSPPRKSPRMVQRLNAK
jgi:hypothetical protein